MYHYDYVSKNDAKIYKNEIEEIIKEVQNLVRKNFTFSYKFIGSSSRNMITFDPKTNKGFDFDVNFYVNDEDEQFKAKEIKHILINAINQLASKKGFSPCEDSTRVITIKKISKAKPEIEYSCDFAIVNEYENESGFVHQEYIHFQKGQNRYIWNKQTSAYYLEEKVEWIKNNRLWNEILDLYIYKKNHNKNIDKKSRSLYAETINEIYQKNRTFI